MGIKQVINRADGHAYYVVDSEGRKVYMGVFFLEHYDDLTSVAGEEGLWFVRDAAADETGQNGDPTVHEGWAMYTWDPLMKVNISGGEVRKGGWRKVAEQESVDGPWGIDEKILKQLVTKTEFNLKVADIEDRILVVEERSSKNESDIANLQTAIDDLEAKKHWHDNKVDLDALKEVNGQLTFQGTPISGNCFLYDNVVDGKLVWIDPTDTSAAEEIVDNSQAIADKFIATTMAWAGMTLRVMEVDGSFTNFVVIKTSTEGGYHVLKYTSQIKSDRKYYDLYVDEGATEPTYHNITAAEAKTILESGELGHDLYFTEKSLAIVPYSTTAANSKGSVIFVETLPTANKVYDGRGIWYPLYDDGVYQPKVFYISVDGVWKDVATLEGSGETKGINGAAFTLAYCEDDPQMPFKKNHLFWKEPEDSATFKAWWKETVLVRKFGSMPQNVNDGDKILTTSSRTLGTEGYTDTCVYSNEAVYYRLFSYTRGGSSYLATTAVNPEPITWDKFYEIATNAMLSKVFSVGDTITLPNHPTFGMIDCEVIAVVEAVDTTKGYVKIASKDALTKLAFGTTNDYDTSALKTWLSNNFDLYTTLKVTEDAIAQEGVTYYVFDGQFKELNIATGGSLPEGVDVYVADASRPDGLFTAVEIPSPSSVGYDNISKTKYYAHQNTAIDWWTTQTSGTNVVTGNDNTVAPTEERGAVVVFTLQEK